MLRSKVFLFSKFTSLFSHFTPTVRVFSVILLLLLLSPVSPAFGGDLLELYRFSRENDPILRAASHEHRASQEIISQAYAGFMPTISFDVEFKNTDQDIISSDNAVFGSGRTEYGTRDFSTTLTQPVFNYSTIIGFKQAKSAIKLSDIQYSIANQEIIMRVAKLYLDAMAARDNLEFAKAEEAAVESQFELASSRVKMGLAPITDLYDARARLASIKANSIEASERMQDALEALKEVSGRLPEFFTIKNLKADFPIKSPDAKKAGQWVAVAQQQNLYIMARDHSLKVADLQVKRVKGGYYPTVDLVGRYNWQRTDGTLFGGGSEIATVDVMLRANYTLFQGGALRSKMREARERYFVEFQGVKQIRRAVARRTKTALYAIKSAISKVEALKYSVASQELVLESKREGFRSGLFTSLALLDATRDLYLARQDYSMARYDYILNTLLLKQVLATLSENDIKMLNGWME